MPKSQGTMRQGRFMQVCPPGLAGSHEDMVKGHNTNTHKKANLIEPSLGSDTDNLQGPGRSQGEGKRPRPGRTKQGEPVQQRELQPEGPMEQLMILHKPSGEPRTPRNPQDHQPTRSNAPNLFNCTAKTRPEGHLINDNIKINSYLNAPSDTPITPDNTQPEHKRLKMDYSLALKRNTTQKERGNDNNNSHTTKNQINWRENKDEILPNDLI